MSGTRNARFGVAGEELTSGLFRTRRMRALGWVVFDGVPFAGLGDIDHIAIGPTGVLAVESKWTNCDWSLEHGKLRGPIGDPVGQAWRNADRLGRFLASRDVSVDVTPILVVWGPGCGWDQDNEWIDGVLLLKGSAVTHRIELLDGPTVEPLDQSTLENALRAVTGYVSGHPDHSSDQRSVRASAFGRAS